MNEIISQTIQSFDFGYCLVVNVLTYIIIQVLKHYNVTLNTWGKRLVLVPVIAIIAVIYYFIGSDSKILLNSAILAPVSWSWIFKPLCKTFKVDYND